jgi:hypothetical protein
MGLGDEVAARTALVGLEASTLRAMRGWLMGDMVLVDGYVG